MKRTLSFLAVIASLGLCPAAEAAVIVYSAALSGPAEAPPNSSPGIGFTTVTLDTTGNTMRVQVSFSGLTGNVTAAHIHGATAGSFTGTAGVITQTPTFTGFPAGVTSGLYDNTFDMALSSSYNAAYITANGGTAATAFAALQTAMQDGKTYLNIHTSTFGGGEIRGFLTPVPEPGAIGLLGLASLGLMSRRRAHKAN